MNEDIVFGTRQQRDRLIKEIGRQCEEMDMKERFDHYVSKANDRFTEIMGVESQYGYLKKFNVACCLDHFTTIKMEFSLGGMFGKYPSEEEFLELSRRMNNTIKDFAHWMEEKDK